MEGGLSSEDARAPGPHDASSDAGSPHDAADGGAVDGAPPHDADPSSGDGGTVEPGPVLARVPDWSLRRRIRAGAGEDVLLEEKLAGLADPSPGASRIRKLAVAGTIERGWSAPAGGYIADFCRHPSGAFSAVLVATERTVSLVRLSPDLLPIAETRVHDPDIAGDPHVPPDAGAIDLLVNGFTWDAARIACVDEGVVATVNSSWNSIIAYRATVTAGAWSEPQRTLIEPPVPLVPFLPTSGSFDTFGAITTWFRSTLDADEDGNVYVATWANPDRVQVHTDAFGDGLAPVPGDPDARLGFSSDVIVTKIDRGGARVWSRVAGTAHPDEPYALRARSGTVAVAGRARRLPGMDNTFWDAFVAVLTTDGEVLGARTVPLQASGIFLAVDVLPGGGLVLGGSDGWSQNPSGLSVTSFGAKLLLEMAAWDAPEVRVALPAGPRQNEIHSVIADGARVWFGGHEDGPIMHTGDSDPTQIHATGVVGFVDEAR